ncbi:GntR family transcriptional regulator [Saccharopolyspora erythraea NRRL 2338]|uniref:Transcriptional regulator, GntR family n=2 Tax=Saccharopolyspora erythraea TaxID=1836 RepID=A4FGX0_SACEN|nr:GntR family transcriptional regulator [Saccharopolyspora erythraea]PFG96998.1 GntR family transcriptional regulator [Saccharopolyspora erythraea NRRL 2338]QRK87212.1 GntR family transcriptional regulator [Saccharopolyspora erythraea]CAM03295.1 transcriptional regulator, GntR family [Saccharopolyspora erythraea NRRL 2338]
MSQPLYTSKTELVTSMLREMIVTGELAAGTTLRQRDLADRLGVSPTPVREALRRLESEGLITTDAHRSATVAESAFDAKEENYLIRAALESLAAQLAAKRITSERLSAIQSVNDRIAGLAEDDRSYGSLNRDFHFAIYQAAESPVLLSLMRMLWQSMPDGPKVVRTHRESAEEHQAIIDALREGDSARAGELTRAHIVGSTHLEDERPARREGGR